MQVELDKLQSELEQKSQKLSENERTYKLQLKKLNQIKGKLLHLLASTKTRNNICSIIQSLNLFNC